MKSRLIGVSKTHCDGYRQDQDPQQLPLPCFRCPGQSERLLFSETLIQPDVVDWAISKPTGDCNPQNPHDLNDPYHDCRCSQGGQHGDSFHKRFSRKRFRHDLPLDIPSNQSLHQAIASRTTAPGRNSRHSRGATNQSLPQAAGFSTAGANAVPVGRLYDSRRTGTRAN